MPETFPGITFDDRGVCSYCSGHEPHRNVAGLDGLADRIRSVSSDSEYDCVVPLSGGKDSTYVLFCAVKKLGLKAVAANYDSGYQSDIARRNVTRACEAMNVPLVSMTPNPGIQRRMLREMLLVSEELGCFTRTCTCCEFMLRMLAIGAARKYNAPFILWGSSALESADDADYEEYRQGRTPFQILASKATRLRSLRLTPRRLGAVVPCFASYTVLSARLRYKAGAPFKYVVNPYELIPFPERSPAVIHFFDYVDWDPRTETEQLKQETGWDHPDGRESRFDCRLFCFVEHRSLKLTGMSESGAIDCRLIREGSLSRERALAREETTKERVVRESAEIVKQLGIQDYRIPALQ
jgi:hypothetical protein